jgi:hypothetical protein
MILSSLKFSVNLTKKYFYTNFIKILFAPSKEKKMNLQIGNIVIVKDYASAFYGQEGIIKAFCADTRAIIHFPYYHDFLYGLYDKNPILYAAIIRQENLLPKKGFSHHLIANALFGENNWNYYYSCETILNRSEPCQHENCPNRSELRAIMNCWGTVFEADLCLLHWVEYHGMRLDSFPFRKKS